MATINKIDVLDREMYEKFEAKKKDLEFIQESDFGNFDIMGPDNRSIFRPENIEWAKKNVFTIDEYNLLMLCELPVGPVPEDVLYSFKLNGDCHVGYLLAVKTRMEPVILKSGRPSKTKTEEKNYYVMASYNFYNDNIEMNVLSDYRITPLIHFNIQKTKNIINTPEDYYEYYKQALKNNEEKRRSNPMMVTVGMWEDVQAELKRLNEKIEELENDLSENYTRRYNSEEE